MVSLIVGDLGPDLRIGAGLRPGVQPVGADNGHELRVLHGRLAGRISGENELTAHITGDVAGTDLIPAVPRILQDLAAGIAGELPITFSSFRLLADVQVMVTLDTPGLS